MSETPVLPDGVTDVHAYVASRVLNPDALAEGATGATRKAVLDAVGVDDAHAWSYADFLAAWRHELADKAYENRLRDLRRGVKRLAFMAFNPDQKPTPEVQEGLTHPRVQALLKERLAAYGLSVPGAPTPEPAPRAP